MVDNFGMGVLYIIWFLSTTLVCLCSILATYGKLNYLQNKHSFYDSKYSHFPETERIRRLKDVKQMFHFGYDNYIRYAFPMDELDPIHCMGRGPDVEHPENININDVLGDYSLTLVDTLDTLAIMGNSSEFKRAVNLIIDNVSFDKNTTVQVFEATIRVLGSLLSAHLILKDPFQPLGDMQVENYSNELLDLAHDLGTRLLCAFDGTATGLPYPRVNLQHGVMKGTVNETCTAGAGSLILEFGTLSKLTGDPVFEGVARKNMKTLYDLRNKETGLLGNTVNIQTGQWMGYQSGVGAGLDSFYEYLLKSYIMFGDRDDLKMFTDLYKGVKKHMRRGRNKCNSGQGIPPLYINVKMQDGTTANTWIDALQAAFPSVQVLNGDIEEAICHHAFYYTLWKKYDALPERFNWDKKVPEVPFYPLRPELAESTYFLYQATKNPFYLHVGGDIIDSLEMNTKAECGYATIHNVLDKSLEDRMESFFLSETCKYLYLLFDKNNYLNMKSHRYLFSTEGHILPIQRKLRTEDDLFQWWNDEIDLENIKPTNISNCENIPKERKYFLPIESQYLEQIGHMVGLYS